MGGILDSAPDLSEQEEEDLFLLCRDYGIEPEDAYYVRPAWAMDLLAGWRRSEIHILNAQHSKDPSEEPASERAKRVSPKKIARTDDLLDELGDELEG